ncbi:hypothetical protein HNR71_000063 [Kribbella sandramycini]|uniref:Uncharacterized protein n=1 Tax=Kribbella sandramycini TaxID=60450 RepID=A0A841S8E9_9ACTN|nr:hypothetical protein [Kribbella sandramycini]
MSYLDYDELDFDSRDAIDSQDLADALDLLNDGNEW